MSRYRAKKVKVNMDEKRKKESKSKQGEKSMTKKGSTIAITFFRKNTLIQNTRGILKSFTLNSAPFFQ